MTINPGLFPNQLSLFPEGEIPKRPKKPALRFYGSKWTLAEWIVSNFPNDFEKLHYVEPFGGGGGVLLWKPPSHLETYNDLDSRLVTFFRVIRETPKELIEALSLTPFSREEYRGSHDKSDSELETARKTFISLWQSIGARPRNLSGWRVQRSRDGRYVTAPNEWLRAIDNLEYVASRLRGVQIEQIPALELIRKSDSINTLFYVDPPYVLRSRSYSNGSYSHELSDKDHIELSETLRELSGYVLLSAYDDPLYEELYRSHGWISISKEARANSGRIAREILWLNPRLAREREGGLNL